MWNGKANKDWLNLVDHHERRIAVCLDEIPLSYEQAASSSGDRCTDGGVCDIECRFLDVGAIRRHRRCRGGSGCFCLVRLRAGYITFFHQRRIPSRVASRICRHRFITRELRASLIENRDVRPRIDLKKYLTGPNFLSLGECDPVQNSIDLGLHCNSLHRLGDSVCCDDIGNRRSLDRRNAYRNGWLSLWIIFRARGSHGQCDSHNARENLTRAHRLVEFGSGRDAVESEENANGVSPRTPNTPASRASCASEVYHCHRD